MLVNVVIIDYSLSIDYSLKEMAKKKEEANRTGHICTSIL